MHPVVACMKHLYRKKFLCKLLLTDVEGSAVKFYKEVDLRVCLYGCRCVEWCKKKKKSLWRRPGGKGILSDKQDVEEGFPNDG